MRSKTSLARIFFWLLFSLVLLSAFSSGWPGIKAEPQKILQKKAIVKTATPSVTSITPQKAVLTQGGEAVVVEAKGANLSMVGLVQVTRAGSPASGIEAALDKSQLPALLKVSLKASSQAPVASDYLLAVFDVSQRKLFDVPNTVLAIEVQAPVRKAISTQKAIPATTAAPIKATKASNKVQEFITSFRVARSLAEIKAAFDKANLSQSEQDELRRKIEASPELQKNLDRHLAEQKASAKALIDQRNREFAAKIEAAKLEQHDLQSKALDQPLGVLLTRCPSADQPTIDIVKGAPLIPAKEFRILGKGFGEPQSGSIDLMIPGPIPALRAIIISWKACEVHARFSGEISGVRASNEASLVLKTSDGKEATKVTSFQPLWDYFHTYDEGMCFGMPFGCSRNWTLNDFNLKNDYIIYEIELFPWGDGHAEITYRPPMNTPNVSARTVVHSGTKALGFSNWDLHVIFRGPKGLPYK